MPGLHLPARANAAPSLLAARCRGCSPPRSCARSAGTSTSTSARASNWSAAAPASPAIRNCWRRWRQAAPAPRISASKCPSASPSTATAASPTSGRCGKSSPPGTGCSDCCATRSTQRIIISAAHFERVEQDGAACACNLPTARVEHADILVGGDGIRSSVRGADGAGGAADLCRLLHLARRAERSRPRAGNA